MSVKSLEMAKNIRKISVAMVYKAHASHIGGALSMADILAVLYSDVLNYDVNNPDWENVIAVYFQKGMLVYRSMQP